MPQASKTTGAKKTPGGQASAAKSATRNELEKTKAPAPGSPPRTAMKVGETPAPGQPAGTIRVPTNAGHSDIKPANPAAARVKSPRELNPLGVQPPKVFHRSQRGGVNSMTIGAQFGQDGGRTITGEDLGAATPANNANEISKTELIQVANKAGVGEQEVRAGIEQGRFGDPVSAAGDRMTFDRTKALSEVERMSAEPG